MTETKRLCLWSGPQHPAYSLSLAFALRNDTEVIEKPFHAHFLRRTGLNPPGRDLILDSLESRPQEIIENLLQLENKRILFVNNMPHHMLGVDLNFLNKFSNIFLIRHPRLLIPALIGKISKPSILERAYEMQKRLYDYLTEQGQQPLVLDTSTLARYPQEVMKLICLKNGIAYQPRMMNWYLHANTSHLETGSLIAMNHTSAIEKEAFSGKYEELYEKCYDYYVDMLVQTSLPVEKANPMLTL
ncbi:MAG: hypothetical protein MRZ79_19920 [Bacteroidia bacterium]|nr:hypothetical protein [Bacteroidia bacterium]